MNIASRVVRGPSFGVPKRSPKSTTCGKNVLESLLGRGSRKKRERVAPRAFLRTGPGRFTLVIIVWNAMSAHVLFRRFGSMLTQFCFHCVSMLSPLCLHCVSVCVSMLSPCLFKFCLNFVSSFCCCGLHFSILL